MSLAAPKNQTKAIMDDLDISSFDNDDIDMPIKNDFQYDDFQKRSMYRLYNNDSIFVSTPTSSGKTVVAQYAIGLSLLHKKKAIYTSPIKSLSNQKFQEFSKAFGRVGILTGDTNIDRKAPVLIMTTEILRSMLYKNDPLLNNVEIVIFDEFHYLAHEQRGGVWEESVIRMPNHINMAFLSASMPNAKEIAEWISKTKHRNVYIEMHDNRPVPLNHSIYIKNNIYTISNHDGKGPLFNSDLLNKVKISNRPPKRCELKKSSFILGLIQSLQCNNLLPALMFEFSINNIETEAEALLSCVGANLINNKEKTEIDNFLDEKVLKRLTDDEKNLDQVDKMIRLLKMGIGIHHSGILPILKETVEILLNNGLIKLVFCTSTIGMGLNLPVRTCCFTNMTKFNGSQYVDLTMTEYQQMSGRAGRRGKDDVGTSVICIAGIFPSKEYLKNLFCGKPEEIKSQFQISFKMVINSFCEHSGMKIHEILRKSFYENSSNTILSEKNKKIEKNKDLLSKFGNIEDCPHFIEKKDDDIEDAQFNSPIFSFESNYKKINTINDQIVNEYNEEFKKALKIGSFVLYMELKNKFVAIIDNIIYSDDEDSDEIKEISLLTLKGEIPCNNLSSLHLLALPSAENIDKMSKDEKKMLLGQYNPKEKLNKYEDFIKVDDSEFTEENNKEFYELSNLHQLCLIQIINSPCLTCDLLDDHFKRSTPINNIRNQIKKDEKDLIVEEKKEYGKYLKMLENMNYITTDENGKYTSTFKGKIANDIYGHEILSTELISRKFLDDCSPEEIAALCSCFVAQRIGLKNDFPPPKISVNMDVKIYQISEMVREVISKMKQYNIPVEEDFYKLNMNQNAMYPVYLWAKGKSFNNIMKYSQKILEGQMASVITKVYSMLTNLADIAKDMEEKNLFDKINEAIKKIKRGVVFAKSLYINIDEKTKTEKKT